MSFGAPYQAGLYKTKYLDHMTNVIRCSNRIVYRPKVYMIILHPSILLDASSLQLLNLDDGWPERVSGYVADWRSLETPSTPQSL